MQFGLHVSVQWHVNCQYQYVNCLRLGPTAISIFFFVFIVRSSGVMSSVVTCHLVSSSSVLRSYTTFWGPYCTWKASDIQRKWFMSCTLMYFTYVTSGSKLHKLQSNLDKSKLLGLFLQVRNTRSAKLFALRLFRTVKKESQLPQPWFDSRKHFLLRKSIRNKQDFAWIRNIQVRDIEVSLYLNFMDKQAIQPYWTIGLQTIKLCWLRR